MEKRNLRKERVGIVTSDKMDKSVVLLLSERVKHPKYGKFVKMTSKFVAHDETTIVISETLLKLWSLVP